MKKTLVQVILILILTLAVVNLAIAGPGPTPTPQPTVTPTSHYFLLNEADDAYILCANGQFVIEVNGRDSLHLVCVGD